MSSLASRCRTGALAAFLAIAAPIGSVAAPAPPNYADRTNTEAAIVNCPREHSHRVDCACLVRVIAEQQRADPDGLLNPWVAASLCPNVAGIKAQETANCNMLPSGIVPDGIDIPAYCECFGTEVARAYQNLGPVQQTAHTSSNLRTDARRICHKSVTTRAAPPGGFVFSGNWQMEYANSKFDLEFNPWRGTTAKSEDSQVMKLSVGMAMWKGGTGQVRDEAVYISEEPARKAFRVSVGSKVGCEIRRVNDELFEGACGAAPNLLKLRIFRR
ncbi:MAG: hypothetical protein QM750_12430 [Rubrivivax sp.]